MAKFFFIQIWVNFFFFLSLSQNFKYAKYLQLIFIWRKKSAYNYFCVTFSIFVKYIYVRIKCESEVNLYDLKKTGPFHKGKKFENTSINKIQMWKNTALKNFQDLLFKDNVLNMLLYKVKDNKTAINYFIQ